MRPRGFVIVISASLLSVLLVLWAAIACFGAEPIAITVTPKRGFSGTPLRILVHVEPNAANRRLTLVVDSPGYWSASDIELDPETRLLERATKPLPEGRYAIVATVVRAGGKAQRAVETVCLSGPNEDCGEGTR